MSQETLTKVRDDVNVVDKKWGTAYRIKDKAFTIVVKQLSSGLCYR